jgi:hypothetical protein
VPKRQIRKRFLKEVEFKIGRGKSLVVLLGLPAAIGLDRVVIENIKGVVWVRATGHERFKFQDGAEGPGMCEYLLANPDTKMLLEDYLLSRFWGQFNWGELFAYLKNRKLNKKIKEKIRKLVNEWEKKAARELNNILKIHKNKRL